MHEDPFLSQLEEDAVRNVQAEVSDCGSEWSLNTLQNTHKVIRNIENPITAHRSSFFVCLFLARIQAYQTMNPMKHSTQIAETTNIAVGRMYLK